MKFWTVVFSTMISAQALALTINFGDQTNWRYNDLAKNPKFQMMLGGADATLVNSSDSVETVIVFSNDLPEHAILKGEKDAWNKLVIANRYKKHGALLKEQTFKVGDEWRYYAEATSGSLDGTPQYNSILAVVKSGKVVIFTFQQPKPVFDDHVTDIKNLYHSLKIDQI